MKQNGFTLLEVIIVIVILGVLASMALPKYTSVVEQSRSAEGVQILTVLRGAQERYRLEFAAYTNNIANLDVTIPTPANFNSPTVSTVDPIASIARSTGTYTLTINADGTLNCTGNASLCAKMGF